MFFECQIISTDFPEFREQSENYKKITFSKLDNLYNAISDYLDSIHPSMNPRHIKIKERMDEMMRNINKIVK